MKSYAKPFSWNLICEVCQTKIKSDEAVTRWDGLVVSKNHKGCFELRHPNDMPLPPMRDDRPLPIQSPESSDTFTSTSGYADIDNTIPSGTFNEDTL